MSLIAHYPLNGDAKDHFGNDGVPSNVTWVDGKIGQAGSFNGVSSRIVFDEVSLFDFSVSFWVKFDADGDFTGSGQMLFGEDGITSSFFRIVNTDEFELATENDNEPRVKWFNTSITHSNYHHISLTRKDSRTVLYIDGVIQGEKTTNNPLTITALGTGWTTNGYVTKGILDDVRIYDHALSEREVRDLSRGLATRFVLKADSISDSSPLSMPVLNSNLPTWNGEYFAFDGTQYINVDCPFSNTIDQVWTVCGWFFSSDVTLTTQQFNNFNNGNEITHTTTGKPLLYLNSGTNDSYIYGPILSNDTWYHIVYIYDQAAVSVSMYVNGVKYSSSNLQASDVPSGLPTTMQFGNNLLGGMKGIKVFATDLSEADALSEYKTGLAVDDHHRMHSAYLSELFEFDYLSPLSSSEVSSAGNGYNNTSGESDPCSGLLTFEDAVAYAEAQGARLPTKDELENDATAGSGCGYDNQLCWSCTKGVDDSEHWVVQGLSTSGLTPEIRDNTQTAYVRFVYDNDLDRPDPVTIEDKPVQKVVGSDATKIERVATKKDQFSEVGISTGMVSWFPLKGDAKDRVSNEVATVDGAVPTGDGYSFDGVDDYIDTGLFSETDDLFNLASFSSSFWLNLRSGAIDSERRLVIGRNQSGGYFDVENENDYVQLRAAGVSVVRFYPTFNQWYHLTVVRNETTEVNSLYLDGVLLGSVTGSSNSYQSEIRIGGGHIIGITSGSSTIDGIIRNVKFYNVELTAEEVAQEYQSSSKSMINKSTAFAKEFIEV